MFIKLNHLLSNMVIGKRLLLLVIILSSLIPLAAAEEDDCLVYFYGTNCAECAKAKAHLNYLKTKYPQLEIKELEVYYNRANTRTLEKYFQSYRIPEASQGLPVLFMPGSYFVGSSTMIDLLESRILDNQNSACSTVEGEKALGLVGEKEPPDVLNTLTLSLVTKAAFRDAFRPGIIAFLLVFLLMLSSLRKKENVQQRGILAVAALFIASLLFGLGLLFQAPVWTTKVVGALAIFASIIRIRGFFGTWKIVFEGISETAEQEIMDYLRYLFTPLGFMIVGFLMAVLSTGRISELLNLLRTLTLDGVYNFKLFSYLFYHSLIIIIMPALMVVILYQAAEKLDKHAADKEPYNDPKAEKWRDHTQKVLRFAVSSIMLIVGFLLLFI